MYLLVILLLLFFISSFWVGYQRMLRLQHLNQKRVIYGFLTAMFILTLMTLAHWAGYFSQEVAARFTMGLYTVVAGFFSGFACKQFMLRQGSGEVIYTFRSLWTEAVPNLLAILLFAFGLYRTHLLVLGPFTGIGLTSGCSLIALGFLGLTMPIVPEFRHKGILIIDRLVPWKEVVSYHWHRENVLQIEYLNTDKTLTDFTTTIPADDHIIIERLLDEKLKEHEQQRKEELHKLHQRS